jgi:hypothetical protein
MPEPDAPTVPAASERWTSYVALAVSLALLVAALVGAYETGAFGTNPHSLRVEQHEAVFRIRRAAEGACANGSYRDCLALYNEAKVLDPAGDNDPAIAENRALATAALAAQAGAGDAQTAAGDESSD